MKFKAGDKVKCVKPDSNNLLTLNDVYTILSTQSFTYVSVPFVTLINGDDICWNSNRFALMPAVTITLPDELFEL